MSILIPFIAQAFFSGEDWSIRSETNQQTPSPDFGRSASTRRLMNKNQPSSKMTGMPMVLLGIVVILISITVGFAGFDTGIGWLSITAFFVAAVGALLSYRGIGRLSDK